MDDIALRHRAVIVPIGEVAPPPNRIAVSYASVTVLVVCRVSPDSVHAEPAASLANRLLPRIVDRCLVFGRARLSSLVPLN